MGPCLAELSVAALDPEVEPASAGEAKLLLRCVGAMLRKHVLLLPELAPKMIETLLAGCGASRLVKSVLEIASTEVEEVAAAANVVLDTAV
jgi:hypothetical protein